MNSASDMGVILEDERHLAALLETAKRILSATTAGDEPKSWSAESRQMLFQALHSKIKDVLRLLPPVRGNEVLQKVERNVMALLDERDQLDFSGDFMLLIHFARVQVTPHHRTLTVPDIARLWGANVPYPMMRYHTVIAELLEHGVPELRRGPFDDFSTLFQTLTLCQSLGRLLPINKTSRAVLPSLPLNTWFAAWLHALSQEFCILIGKTPVLSAPECLRTADKIWSLLHEFELDKQADYAETRAALHRCYQAAQKTYEGKFYFFETGQAKTLWGRFKSVIRGITHTGKVSFLLERLRTDLANVTACNHYETRAKLLEPGLRGELYVSAYRASAARFERLSAGAFELRKRYEEKLRGKKDYIRLLDELDTALVLFHQELMAAKHNGLMAIETQYPNDDFFKRANACFEILNEPCVRQLNNINWVYHTAYGWRSTEAYLAFEMEARNRLFPKKKFEKYHLEECKTLSDYLVDVSAEANSDKKIEEKRLLRDVVKEVKHTMYIKVHPDKGIAGDVHEQSVREYCSKTVGTLCDDALHLTQLWHKGQWREIAPVRVLKLQDTMLMAGAGVVEEDVSQCDATFLAEPTRPLDLSVLVAHQQYVKWAANEPDLNKRVYRAHEGEIAPFLNSFYDGDPENEFKRFYFGYVKSACVNNLQKAEAARQLTKEIEARIAAADEKIREQDEKMREQDEKMREQDIYLASINQEIYSSTMLFLTKKLKKAFRNISPDMISDTEVVTQFNAFIAWYHEYRDYYTHTQEYLASLAIEALHTKDEYHDIPALLYLKEHAARLFPSFELASAAEAISTVETAPTAPTRRSSLLQNSIFAGAGARVSDEAPTDEDLYSGHIGLGSAQK